MPATDTATCSVTDSEIRSLDLAWRASNYLGAAQIYLQDNVLLREPLAATHIKPRLLGHWGTVPGINFVYVHLNRVICNRDLPMLLVTGPGHGAPGNLANLFLEGSLGHRYPELDRTAAGLQQLVKRFSWPGGFASHLTPMTPGTIHEGGELGYALATAFGAAFDDPNLVVACIVGDGEAETGPTATAWHSTKYLDPATDGCVLPILHLNSYKIASRTIFGAMSDGELTQLFRGYGYYVQVVDVMSDDVRQDPNVAHRCMALALDRSLDQIHEIQHQARSGNPLPKPQWPLIILRSPKGWTGISELQGDPIEGSWRAHQVPAGKPQSDPEHLAAVERWLQSYRPQELFDDVGRPRPEVTEIYAQGNRRMGLLPQSNGGSVRQELDRPAWRDHATTIEGRGNPVQADTRQAGLYLRDVIGRNRGRFRIVCPDEIDSNRLSAVFETTQRQFAWPTPSQDPSIGPDGAVLEILSEHTCQGWLQGYLLTGRHGLFPCYESFAPIVDSMMGQFAKFLKFSAEVPWRKPVSSLTYLLSSQGWRQDHNGYSHQMPGFINALLDKKAAHVRIYLPPDSNCLLSTLDHCLTSKSKINIIIAAKQPMPQWLSADEADQHCRRGASVWDWAGTATDQPPQVVLASSGAYPTKELLAAAWLLKRDLPELRLRVVNVTDLLILEPDSHHPHGLNPDAFAELFTRDVPVIYNFHGYPSAVKQLLFDRPDNGRFLVNGYREEGTTTSPFTLLAMNGIDRYSVAMQAIRAAAEQDERLRGQAERLLTDYLDQQQNLLKWAETHGEDSAEITGWQWSSQPSND